MRFAFLALFILLSACQPAYVNGVANEDSPYLSIPVDSRLTLQRSVTLPGHEDGVYFQSGKIFRWHEVNRYFPYCVLQSSQKLTTPRTIAPDRFVITNVSQEFFNHIVLRSGAPRVMVASAMSLFPQGRRDHENDDKDDIVATVMLLQSARQPGVKSLTCAAWGTVPNRSYVTVRHIRQTLGEFFELELAGG